MFRSSSWGRWAGSWAELRPKTGQKATKTKIHIFAQVGVVLPYYSNPRPPPPVGLVLGLRVPAPTSAHPDVFCSSAWITDRTAQPARLCAHHVGSAAEIVRHGHNPRFLVQQRVRCPCSLPARGLLTCDVQLPAPSVQASLEESTRPQPTLWFAPIPPKPTCIVGASNPVYRIGTIRLSPVRSVSNSRLLRLGSGLTRCYRHPSCRCLQTATTS